MGEETRYSHAGEELIGLVERPDRPNGRAVVIYHEANGLGSNVRRRARMFADLGYVAFAADLYGGGRSYGAEGAVREMERLKAEPKHLRARIRAGFDQLLALGTVDPARTAAIGYCFGGTAALELARSGAPLAAAISFHGLLTTALPAAHGTIAARILACTGARDPLVPPADVAAFQEEMAAAGADWQLIVYGRAMHSFTNRNVAGMGDPRMDYDPSADRQSWAAALLLLDEALGTG
jgi:dienelactone hydrolase